MDKAEFLFDNFKLSLDYLGGQFSRLWQRFNFFLTVEISLFAFFGWLAFDKHNLPATRLACILGVFVSVLWYVVAAQDRALVEIYRERLRKAARKVSDIKQLDCSDYATEFVGSEPTTQHHPRLLSWYCKSISITHLPVWLSLLHLAVWIVLLFSGSDWLKGYSLTS